MMDENVPIKKFYWMNVCIKCNKSSGKLLACNQNECFIVVHEDCLGGEAQFDELGRFCCPFCVCKLALQGLREAERKVDLAKIDLSGCLGGGGFGTVNVGGSRNVSYRCVEVENDEVDNDEVNRGEVTKKGNEVSDVENDEVENDEVNRVEVTDKGSGGIDVENDEVRKKGNESIDVENDEVENVELNQVEFTEKGNEGIDVENDEVELVEEGNAGGVNEHEDEPEEVEINGMSKLGDDGTQTETFPEYHEDACCDEVHDLVKENVVEAEENQEQAHKDAEKIVCKESVPQVQMKAKGKVNDTTASICVDTDTNTISEKVTRAECVDIPKGSSRKSKTVAKPHAIFTKLQTPKMRRKRVPWSVEEEELKKGVQEHSKKVKENLGRRSCCIS